jgi:hypothetical protein
MTLIRNICSLCNEENFPDALYDADSGMCNECTQKLNTKELFQLKYTIEPQVSSFEKFVFNLMRTKVYRLKVEVTDKTKSLPPFKLLGSRLNFPSDFTNAEVLYEIQTPLDTNIHQVEIMVNETLYCKLFVEDIYNANIIHPANTSLRIGV